MVVELL